MPKEPKVPTSHRRSESKASRADSVSPTDLPQAQRNAAIWTAADDEVLASARASGLNWQPIAAQYFPNKTANACRKRHERLTERRNQDGWEAEMLDALATGYMECRREMWSVLGERLGERWSIIEAKCMEKGLKNLQSIARSSHKRRDSILASNTDHTSHHQRGKEDHEGDSGLGLSDAELDAGEIDHHHQIHPPQNVQSLQTSTPSFQPRTDSIPPHEQHQRPPYPFIIPQQQPKLHRAPPPPLPLYRPPLAALANQRQRAAAANNTTTTTMLTAYDEPSRPQSAPCGPFRVVAGAPNTAMQRTAGVSIQSMLLPMEVQRV